MAKIVYTWDEIVFLPVQKRYQYICITTPSQSLVYIHHNDSRSHTSFREEPNCLQACLTTIILPQSSNQILLPITYWSVQTLYLRPSMRFADQQSARKKNTREREREREREKERKERRSIYLHNVSCEAYTKLFITQIPCTYEFDSLGITCS